MAARKSKKKRAGGKSRQSKRVKSSTGGKKKRSPVNKKARKAGRPRKNPAGKHRRSVAERRNQTTEEAKKRAELDTMMEREFSDLETDEQRILWYAEHGVEPNDIATRLGMEDRIENDADVRLEFERLCKLGAANMRIQLAETINREARMGQVTALANAAKAYLSAFRKEAPNTEFAGNYRTKVEEILETIRDENHGHIMRKFRFEEEPFPSSES